MKSGYFYFFALFFLVLTDISAQTGKWQKVDSVMVYLNDMPGAWPFEFVAIDCYDENHCVAFGNLLLQLYEPWNRVTSDGGNTWITTLRDTIVVDTATKEYIYQPERVNDVAYPDSTLCIAICDKSYYWLSRDGCQTWKKYKFVLDDPFNNAPTLSSISFYNSKIGAIWGDELYLTSDGGNNWDSIDKYHIRPDSLGKFATYDLSIMSPKKIILWASNITNHRDYEFISEDFGKNWSYIPLDTLPAFSICFLNEKLGWAGGGLHVASQTYRSIIKNTTDGGITWSIQLDTLLPKGSFRIGKIYFYDSLHGAAITDYWFVLWKTNDGGKHWYVDTTYNSRTAFTYFSDIALLTPHKILGVTKTFEGRYIYKYEEATGVDEGLVDFSNKSEIKIYPNPPPFGSDIYVEFNTEKPGEAELCLYNSIGDLTVPCERIFLDIGKHKLKFSPGNSLSSGVYWLKITEGDKFFGVKPIVILK